jgi:hypothetical protein
MRILQLQMNTKPFSSSAETLIAKPKQFTEEEIASRYFLHSHMTLAGTRKDDVGHIVVIEQCDDGYCRCKEPNFTAKKKVYGLRAETMNLFSGNLEPAQEMDENIAALAAQLRKEGL